MGVVWQARDEILSRDVAVKELVWPAYFSEAEQQTACRRAVREARVTARLTHRNVIRVFDIIEEDGCPWIVMEFLPYGSLRDFVAEQGPLSPAEAAEMGLGILAALRAAHAKGIVHRDVKPANILMAPDRAVLTDFGVARSAGNSVVTTVGLLIGSPSYIAPEHARGGESGPPEDLWGLGASLYAAVEGHGPFDRDGGALASLTAVVADEPAPSGNAGPLLWTVISGLLRKDPGKRLDAAEAERMLRRVVSASAVPDTLVAPRPRRPGERRPGERRPGERLPGERRSSNRRPRAALAGSALLAVLAASGTAAGLALTGSPPRETAAAATTRPPAVGTRAPASTRSAAAATAHPPAASTHPGAPAGIHMASHTSRAHSSPSSSRVSAPTTDSFQAGLPGTGARGGPPGRLAGSDGRRPGPAGRRPGPVSRAPHKPHDQPHAHDQGHRPPHGGPAAAPGQPG
jgi:eukaryotic-like serine/threonine-protein kinase